jgi:prophage maintenance system killer protein
LDVIANNGKHIASQDVQLTLTMLTCRRFSMRREETRFSEGCGRDTSGAILAAIEETFEGNGNPTAPLRAAHLLDFVTKDHPFINGNKRIGALLLLEYVRRNGLLTHADGKPHLTDNVIVVLALLVAQSEPIHKDLMIRLILNLLEGGSAIPEMSSERDRFRLRM